MSGWIGSSFAVTPFGVGTPIDATAPPVERPTGVRYLNPVTRDYEVDNEGEMRRMPAVRQRILIAVTQLLKSSSVEPNRGIRMPGKIGKDFTERARAAVIAATAEIVALGHATIDAVQVLVPQVGRAVIVITFTDLTAGAAQDSLIVTT